MTIQKKRAITGMPILLVKRAANASRISRRRAERSERGSSRLERVIRRHVPADILPAESGLMLST
jgi:hypothetical protein